MRVSRRGFLSVASALGAAALTGCTTEQDGTPVPVTTPRPRPVSLGVFDYRPYAFTDRTGQVTGEVVEVVRAICDLLGRKLTVKKLPYEAILPEMDARGIDVVGGLSIRERNCVSLDFTVPDHVSLTAFVVPQGNPKGLSTFTEVVATKARLGAVIEATDVAAAEQAGVTDLQMFPTPQEMLRAVTEKEIDCAVYDDITLRDELTRTTGLELRPPFEPPGGAPRYGFAFRKGDTLRDEFDGVLPKLHDSGEWLSIARAFGFTESNIPGTDRVNDKACER